MGSHLLADHFMSLLAIKACLTWVSMWFPVHKHHPGHEVLIGHAGNGGGAEVTEVAVP